MAYPKVSTLTLKCWSNWGCLNTGSDVMCFLSVSKVSCCLVPQFHGVSFLVSLLRGFAMCKNWYMKG